MKSQTYRERVYYVLPGVDTGHILVLVLILNNKFSLFVAKSPSVFVFFFLEGVLVWEYRVCGEWCYLEPLVFFLLGYSCN